MLTLMSKAIVEMHQTLLKLVKMGSAVAGGVPSSQLIECDPASESANLSGQTQTPMISRSFATALMVGLCREHSLPSLVSPPLRAAGPSGPLQGSGTLVNPSSVRVPFEWLATTCLSIKVHTHHGPSSSGQWHFAGKPHFSIH